MKRSFGKLYIGILVTSLTISACKKEDTQTTDAINTHSLTVQNQLNGSAATALSLINLTEGKAYHATDAKANQAKVDFVYHQYTGTALNKDSYFFSVDYLKTGITGYERDVRDVLGIQTWTTITQSVITGTDDLSVADFDAVGTATELRSAVARVTNTKTVNEFVTEISGQPAYAIYAFEAVNNKVGLLKLKAARTGTGGGIDIDIKVEK